MIQKLKRFFGRVFGKKDVLNLVYPTSWETMDLQDFKDVCNILSHPNGRKETLFLLWCKLAHICPADPDRYDPKMIRGKFPFTYKGKDYVISPSVVREGCHDMEYILDTIGLPPSPLDRVDRKLYGISFEQYYHASAYMLRYAADKDNAWKKEAVKALTNGRIRRLRPWQQKGVVIWWNGVGQFLKKKYPAVLTDGDEITDKTPADILQELLSTMNDNKPQDNDKILKSDVHAVLFSLNKIYENAKTHRH